MSSLSPGHRRSKVISGKAPLSSCRNNNKPHSNSLPEKHHSGLVRPFVSTSPLSPSRLPFSAAMQNGESSVQRQPSKLLVKVSVENSPGAMPVVMLAEDSVGDLVKAALLFYEREKRRPFLKDTDPKHYQLHYSSFSLQSLQPDEKLMNLGSRNFYLCSKPLLNSCCSDERENMKIDSARPWMIFVHLLL